MSLRCRTIAVGEKGLRTGNHSSLYTYYLSSSTVAGVCTVYTLYGVHACTATKRNSTVSAVPMYSAEYLSCRAHGPPISNQPHRICESTFTFKFIFSFCLGIDHAPATSNNSFPPRHSPPSLSSRPPSGDLFLTRQQRQFQQSLHCLIPGG